MRLPRPADPHQAAAGATVLVVDDDKDMCWALQLGLRLAGFETLVAHTAEGALAPMAPHTFEFAIVDARLPDMDGFQLVGELRRLYSPMSVVLISGYYFPDDRRVADALQSGGIDAFLAKPFRIEAALAALSVR